MSAPSVLIIEDNPQTRKLLRITLESHGCDVLEAEDGTAALRQLDPAPDVIIQDLLLPDMDGLALMAQLRANASTATTPVIAVSGFAQQLFGPAGDAAGFAARLQKPVEPSRLLATLDPYLGVHLRGEGVKGRRVLVADDNDIQRKLTVLRFRDAGYDVIEAADGVAALLLAKRERPDIVLSDVLMPGLDGFALCRAIRADAAIGATPVVLTSSVFVEHDDRELAERAGATAFVTREPDLAGVLRAVNCAIGSTTPSDPRSPGYEELHHARMTQTLLTRNEDNLALEAELEQSHAQLAVMAGIAETLSRCGDLDCATEGILVRCLEATGLAGLELYLCTAEGVLVRKTVLGDPPRVSFDDVRRAAASEQTTTHGDAILLNLRRGDATLGVVVLGSPGIVLQDEQIRLCSAIAHQISQALSLARAQADLIGSREQTVERLATAIALRDGGTSEHTRRMSFYCAMLARRIGLQDDVTELVRVASAMHDIGKVAIPDSILLKPGSLTADEYAHIQEHARIGHDILVGSGSDLLELAATIALCHHEHWDGSGYPQGLSGEQIPVEARIAAIADVFDALISDRPYRPAMPVATALEILREGRGRHFDPQLVDAFLDSVDELPSD